MDFRFKIRVGLLFLFWILLIVILHYTFTGAVDTQYKSQVLLIALIITSIVIIRLITLIYNPYSKEMDIQMDDIKRLKGIVTVQEERMRTLYDVGLSLSSSLTKERLIRLILNNAVSNFQADMGFLLIYNDLQDAFLYEAGYKMDKTFLIREKFVPKDNTVLTKIMKNRQPIIIDNVFRSLMTDLKLFKENKVVYFKDIDSLMLIPLLVEDKVLGILHIFCPKETVRTAKKDVLFLASYSVMLSVALGSAIQSEYAVLDRLTMVYNHEYFQGRLSEELARCRRYKLNMSLLLLDIDHFKKINDTYGHQAGDAVLKTLAGLLKWDTRVTDIVARYGGEEFAILLPETTLKGARVSYVEGDTLQTTSTGGALEIAEKLRRDIENYKFVADGIPVKVTVSLGVASWNWPEDDSMDKKTLISLCDEQLYRAKNNGRNMVCYDESRV